MIHSAASVVNDCTIDFYRPSATARPARSMLSSIKTDLGEDDISADENPENSEA
jgi:hypothetical protein